MRQLERQTLKQSVIGVRCKDTERQTERRDGQTDRQASINSQLVIVGQSVNQSFRQIKSSVSQLKTSNLLNDYQCPLENHATNDHTKEKHKCQPLTWRTWWGIASLWGTLPTCQILQCGWVHQPQIRANQHYSITIRIHFQDLPLFS